MSQNLFKMALAALLMSTMAPALAHAEEASDSSSAMKIEDTTPVNKTPGEDVDETLTNKQLRASSGSKSRWSISNQVLYNGGTVEKPLAEIRPNIIGAPGTPAIAALIDDISGKFNIDARHSISAGIGVRWVTPFHGANTPGQIGANGKKIYDGDKVDADNPFVTFQYIYKVGKIQNVLQVTPQFYTNTDLVNAGFVMNAQISQQSIVELGSSGLSLGLFMAAQGFAYKHDEAGQNDYSLGIDPYAEYVLNDTFNLRTVFNIGNFDHVRGDAGLKMTHEPFQESIGVGISITRDVFLYPNVQFIIDNIRPDMTNVALASYINLF